MCHALQRSGAVDRGRPPLPGGVAKGLGRGGGRPRTSRCGPWLGDDDGDGGERAAGRAGTEWREEGVRMHATGRLGARHGPGRGMAWEGEGGSSKEGEGEGEAREVGC